MRPTRDIRAHGLIRDRREEAVADLHVMRNASTREDVPRVAAMLFNPLSVAVSPGRFAVATDAMAIA